MPWRVSKMNCFIFGFQRRVWCPKWTPASNNSLTPILITVFHWLSAHRNSPTDHPADHGMDFDVVLAARFTWTGLDFEAVPPFHASRILPAGTKGLSKIADRSLTAIIIFNGKRPPPLSAFHAEHYFGLRPQLFDIRQPEHSRSMFHPTRTGEVLGPPTASPARVT